PLEPNGQIPKSLAVPLMVENEIKGWKDSALAERWDTMQPYLLGEPHGARSSLFVSQETAIARSEERRVGKESRARGTGDVQAEDCIRDFHVTGVQTCALPI